jgi:hypothetical protein
MVAKVEGLFDQQKVKLDLSCKWCVRNITRFHHLSLWNGFSLILPTAEVVQQSKARRKDDFLLAFSPVIAEATASAYKGATSDVQQKLRRVVEVWRQRQIFEAPIQEAVESRIDGMSIYMLQGMMC